MGTANQLVEPAFTGCPAASLATTVNFIWSPLCTSETFGVISRAAAAWVGALLPSWAQIQHVSINTHNAVRMVRALFILDLYLTVSSVCATLVPFSCTHFGIRVDSRSFVAQ